MFSILLYSCRLAAAESRRSLEKEKRQVIQNDSALGTWEKPLLFITHTLDCPRWRVYWLAAHGTWLTRKREWSNSRSK